MSMSDIARKALEDIDRNGCTRTTDKSRRCWDDGRDEESEYLDGRWCDACVARAALIRSEQDTRWQTTCKACGLYLGHLGPSTDGETAAEVWEWMAEHEGAFPGHIHFTTEPNDRVTVPLDGTERHGEWQARCLSCTYQGPPRTIAAHAINEARQHEAAYVGHHAEVTTNRIPVEVGEVCRWDGQGFPAGIEPADGDVVMYMNRLYTLHRPQEGSRGVLCEFTLTDAVDRMHEALVEVDRESASDGAARFVPLPVWSKLRHALTLLQQVKPPSVAAGDPSPETAE